MCLLFYFNDCKKTDKSVRAVLRDLGEGRRAVIADQPAAKEALTREGREVLQLIFRRRLDNRRKLCYNKDRALLRCELF